MHIAYLFFEGSTLEDKALSLSLFRHIEQRQAWKDGMKGYMEEKKKKGADGPPTLHAPAGGRGKPTWLEFSQKPKT